MCLELLSECLELLSECLELLSEYEVEVAAATCSEHLVEAVCPVESHQTYHREEDAYADAGRALHVEGVELVGVVPCVTALEECESVDGGVCS